MVDDDDESTLPTRILRAQSQKKQKIRQAHALVTTGLVNQPLHFSFSTPHPEAKTKTMLFINGEKTVFDKTNKSEKEEKDDCSPTTRGNCMADGG